MLIYAYGDTKGNNAQLRVDFDRYYFPSRYTVRVNRETVSFPGTKWGAKRAHKYYAKCVSALEKGGD